MEENTNSSNLSSNGDNYNCAYFHESQNEENNIERIDCGLDLSGSAVDSVDTTLSEIASVQSDDNSDSIVSSQAEVQEDVDSISSAESNEESDSSDEEQMHFTNENERAEYVRTAIEEWAREPGKLSKKKLDNLLSKLHPVFPNLPLSYKTLLQTPGINLIPVDSGKLWYKGIAFNLDSMDLQEYLAHFQEIVIDINIDGLPLHKSSPVRFWPILGRLVKTKNEPFIIALFKGRVDPNVKDFLEPFVREVGHLVRNGYINNDNIYKFSIRHYILDAPARAKVKCCVEHGGYYACEKCEVVGEWIDNRMTYVELDATLRTDESFRDQKQPYHHKSCSPLLDIQALLVSQFRLDGLHLIDLGVFKRFLLALRKWNGP
ncbi:hypothetical protein X777_03231 [Ooceraea biroi]|uniref:Transposase domain-containing protein n=1 Tax=Ooceraea biroi TaxID=2015173 RepID=A0A026WM73_OOCBI|nr:hypothetical protein X777_03231 [Ooceraea biroi]